jgi:hypothetical protein
MPKQPSARFSRVIAPFHQRMYLEDSISRSCRHGQALTLCNHLVTTKLDTIWFENYELCPSCLPATLVQTITRTTNLEARSDDLSAVEIISDHRSVTVERYRCIRCNSAALGTIDVDVIRSKLQLPLPASGKQLRQQLVLATASKSSPIAGWPLVLAPLSSQPTPLYVTAN